MTKSYIVNDEGKPRSASFRGKPTAVVIDYESFTKIESLLLDYGLGKAMEEVESDEEVDLEEAKRISGFELRKSP